ncbi:hypothetical protein HY486_03275 [Candidatus Woesearchaeota archaeon]|nr:hypothetical protein [Candidatus Woesearchaeota archaeon]
MVQVLGLSPEWFFPADSILGFISVIFAFFVCLVSYRAYLFSRNNKYLLWGLAFFLLAGGGLIRVITNLMVSYVFDPVVFKIGYSSFILATIAAFSLILFLRGDRLRTVLLVYLLTIGLTYFSSLYYRSFYLATFLLTGVIAWDFYDNARKRGGVAKLTFASFSVLSLAQLLFLASLTYPMHVVAHVFQFVSYGLLFIVMWGVGK